MTISFDESQNKAILSKYSEKVLLLYFKLCVHPLIYDVMRGKYKASFVPSKHLTFYFGLHSHRCMYWWMVSRIQNRNDLSITTNAKVRVKRT